MDLYIRSPIGLRLDGIELNWSITGTTLLTFKVHMLKTRVYIITTLDYVCFGSFRNIALLCAVPVAYFVAFCMTDSAQMSPHYLWDQMRGEKGATILTVNVERKVDDLLIVASVLYPSRRVQSC
jgi:hypothetical protein